MWGTAIIALLFLLFILGVLLGLEALDLADLDLWAFECEMAETFNAKSLWQLIGTLIFEQYGEVSYTHFLCRLMLQARRDKKIE